MHELTPFGTADTLNEQLIAQQREKGQTGTMTARREQEKTIRAVSAVTGYSRLFTTGSRQ